MTDRPLEPDRAISLKHAAEEYGFTVLTLRAEADRGNLTIYKIGKRYCTTPADIREMVNRCRVDPKGRAFTLIRSASNGSSETDRALSAQAALQTTLQALKNNSRNTSGSNTNQRAAGRR